MNQVQSISVKLAILSATALPMFPAYSYIQSSIPDTSYAIPTASPVWHSNYGKFESLDYIKDPSNVKLDIIINFATELLQNTEELQPAVVQAISQHFWELF